MRLTEGVFELRYELLERSRVPRCTRARCIQRRIRAGSRRAAGGRHSGCSDGVYAARRR